MSPLEALPAAAAVLIAVLALLGAGLALTGAIGMVRLNSFYERIHAPTLGTSWGTAAIALAWTLTFSLLEHRLMLHALALAVLVTVTTPITLMLLARAALQRDRAEGRLPERLDPSAHPLRAPDAPRPGADPAAAAEAVPDAAVGPASQQERQDRDPTPSPANRAVPSP